MSVQSSSVQRYLDLSRRKSSLEDELGEIKKELGALEETLVETFALEGVQNMSLDGATVYLHRQVWAAKNDSDVTTQQICEALTASDLSGFVAENFNWQTLSAYVRERDDQGEELPEPLARLIHSTERYSLRVRGK